MSADTVLFVVWNRPAVGREAKGVALFQEFMAHLTEQQQRGNIESFEPVLLQVHGGDLNGFILVRGTRQKLGELRASPVFSALVVRCMLNVDGFGMVDGYTGTGVTTEMALYSGAVNEQKNS